MEDIKRTITAATIDGWSINQLIEAIRERDDKKWPQYGVRWGLRFKETGE